MAHKKAAGSATNLKDSNPKYRGLKLSNGQFAHAGNIIVRQKGDKYQLGLNVYKGKDFTIHASIDGIVSFRKKNFIRYDGRKYLKTVIDILPEDGKKRGIRKNTTKVQEAKKIIKKDSVRRNTNRDDLTKIKGIGSDVEKALNKAGVFTFTDLSSSKIGDLRSLLVDNNLSQYNPKTWKKQATLAKNKKWDALKTFQDELSKE